MVPQRGIMGHCLWAVRDPARQVRQRQERPAFRARTGLCGLGPDTTAPSRTAGGDGSDVQCVWPTRKPSSASTRGPNLLITASLAPVATAVGAAATDTDSARTSWPTALRALMARVSRGWIAETTPGSVGGRPLARGVVAVSHLRPLCLMMTLPRTSSPRSPGPCWQSPRSTQGGGPRGRPSAPAACSLWATRSACSNDDGPCLREPTRLAPNPALSRASPASLPSRPTA